MQYRIKTTSIHTGQVAYGPWHDQAYLPTLRSFVVAFNEKYSGILKHSIEKQATNK